MSQHRHERSSWLICGGYIEWCYQCGAWRQLRRISSNGFTRDMDVNDGRWQRPSGIGGPNPAMQVSKKAKP